APVHRRPSGPGPRPSDERGGAHLEFPLVAAGLFGAVLRRRLLAGLPENRLLTGASILPNAATAVRRIGDTGVLKPLRQLRGPDAGRGRLLPAVRHRGFRRSGRNPEDDRHAIPLGALPLRASGPSVRALRTAVARVPRRT